jgi:chromosome partitioning protein
VRFLRQFNSQFDVGIIDTPGVIGMQLKAALTAADAVVCPLTLGLYDTAGLAQLWQFIKMVKTGGYNPKLRMIGMLPSRVNTRDKIVMAELDALRKHPTFGPAILPFTLAERVPVARAINLRLPVWRGAKTASHKAAGQEWKAACGHVLTSLGR